MDGTLNTHFIINAYRFPYRSRLTVCPTICPSTGKRTSTIGGSRASCERPAAAAAKKRTRNRPAVVARTAAKANVKGKGKGNGTARWSEKLETSADMMQNLDSQLYVR